MYYFIVNPKSSSGRGLKIWGIIASRLQDANAEYKVFFTKGRGHATALAKKLSTELLPCTIVAVGGDGTANEVINGLENYHSIRFGYIPTGSGNDLARGLSLPSTPESALDAILAPQHIRHVAVGINEIAHSTHRFIVSTGIGFDAAVCHEALHSNVKKVLNLLKLGKLTYVAIALKQLALLPCIPLTLTLDDQEPVHYPGIFFAAAMNLKYEGGGFMFCPKADPGDDFLDLCVVESMPKLKALLLLPKAFHGGHVNAPGVHILRCKKAVMEVERPLAVHTDGESQGIRSTMSLTLSQEKLPFIVG